MRAVLVAAALAAVGLAGCERVSKIDGPTVKKFTGRVVADGKPLQFGGGDKVILNVTSEKAQRFGIPIKPDGSFDIGQMPLGKYTGQVSVEREAPADAKSRKTPPVQVRNVPGFEIRDGQTEYTIELGKGFKL